MPDFLTENHAPTVCLDGAQVKRQRELHGLTQLYISKVVGVTTDTISRWENNRYPTIRRENAINLADALGVPLEEILQQPAEDDVDVAVPVRRRRSIMVAGLLCLVLLLLGVVLFFSGQEPIVVDVSAERILPAFAAPGAEIPVQLRLARREGLGGFILREHFPKGWKLTEAFPPPSSLDNVTGVARWIIKVGDTSNKVVYLVKVAESLPESGQASFRGEMIAGSGDDRISTPVGGETAVRAAPYHWADADGDGRIDDVEMLDTSYTVDEMSGVHIDWNHLEHLWDAGAYHWDDARQLFVPGAISNPATH